MREFGPFSPVFSGRTDYRDLVLPATQKACRHEAVWLPQYVLLDGTEGMASVVDAVTKIYENRHELQ